MYLIFGLGLVAFVVSLILTPLIRDGFRLLGVVDRPDGGRKRHGGPIPRVGGIAIALAYVAAFAIMLLLPFSYGSDVSMALPRIWKLGCAAGLVFATGLFDDLVGYFPWQKLVGQIWAAMIAYFAGVQIHIFADRPLQLWWNIPLSILWLVGCTNAFNLIDGLDGLAAGVGLFATITMLLAAFANHNLQMALVTMPLVGALIGFLRYNFNPASVFLGDCGSLLIGFLLGCYGVLWSEKSATLLGMTAPLMALAIPLLDAGLSVIRRFLRHQPIFGADSGHIHHMLLARGLTARKAALLLYGICGIGAALSLTLNAFQNEFAGLIVVLFCVSAWIGIQHLGYTEFAAARQLVSKGTFRRIIDFHTRLQQFERSLEAADSLEGCWEIILSGCRDFGFHSVRLATDKKIFEAVLTPEKPGPFWQIRIPLPDACYLNFTRCTRDEPFSLVVVGEFAQSVGITLASKVASLESAVHSAVLSPDVNQERACEAH
jgi:UDP-GlcNAc:undecaprenyl-phosphate/decaprenyl-phosphate GlcNAc-1-phosphate transferase